MLLLSACASSRRVELAPNGLRYALVFAVENGRRTARVRGVSIQMGDARCVTDDLGACLLRLRPGAYPGLAEAEGYRSYASVWTVRTDAMITIPMLPLGDQR